MTLGWVTSVFESLATYLLCDLERVSSLLWALVSHQEQRLLMPLL